MGVVDRSSWPWLAGFAGAAGALGAWAPGAAAVPLLALGFTAWFFRDPERRPPAGARVLLSPADGRVLRSDPQRVSVFMGLFDVHVCRSPAGGRVRSVHHVPGRFLAAFRQESSDCNERATVTVEDGATAFRFSLVAGLVARRIVCRVREGDRLEPGQRVGIIRFGSRVDVDLPGGARPAVAVGQRVVAGETVIAHLPGSR